MSSAVENSPSMRSTSVHTGSVTPMSKHGTRDETWFSTYVYTWTRCATGNRCATSDFSVSTGNPLNTARQAQVGPVKDGYINRLIYKAGVHMSSRSSLGQLASRVTGLITSKCYGDRCPSNRQLCLSFKPRDFRFLRQPHPPDPQVSRSARYTDASH